MIAFDTDVLTGILLGNTTFVQQAAAIPVRQQGIPIIVIEEIIYYGGLFGNRAATVACSKA